MPTCLAVVIYGCQQGGTCWNLIQGKDPEFFGGATNAWNWSFCSYEDLFQGCPARPHLQRVWGFLLPTDRTPSVIKSLHRLRGTVDTVSAHHQITGAACQRGTAELAYDMGDRQLRLG